MKTQKIIISKQVSLEQITKCCNDDLKVFTEKFFHLEFTWLYNAYSTFKDFDKYIILVYLVNKTLKIYNSHFYTLSFEGFYNSNLLEIDKISIIELVNELSISKETVRRKLNELNKAGIIKRNKKQILMINPFMFQKPINNIKTLSKLLTFVSMKLKKIYNLNYFDDGYFEKVIKKNYTRYWHAFLNFQLDYILRLRKQLGSFDHLYIFAICVVNQTFNLKNSINNNNKNSLDLNNFTEYLTDHTKHRSRGLNPTTIAELTKMPRASVIRKIKDLKDNKLLVRDNKNLYTLVTSKASPSRFKKMNHVFDKNQLSLRNCLKDLLNYIMV